MRFVTNLQSYSLLSDFHDPLVKVDADGVHVRRRERLGHEPLRYGGLSDASLTYMTTHSSIMQALTKTSDFGAKIFFPFRCSEGFY